MAAAKSRIPAVLEKHESELLSEWSANLATAPGAREGLMRDAEIREQAREFLTLVRSAASQGEVADVQGQAYSAVREMLAEVSRSRVQRGYTTAQIATFILSFKKPLFERLRKEIPNDAQALADEMWRATALLDALGLYTTEVFQKSREEIIQRQQQEMLELSTPVVKLWDGVLALPMIGTLDSARTQVVMETLLQRIVETGADIAIIDITGVPTVDTLVAQHLIKTVTAARLMGAECIISGIRPQIAQTIVHLGVDLAGITTKATLADAFVLALKQTGQVVRRAAPTINPQTPTADR